MFASARLPFTAAATFLLGGCGAATPSSSTGAQPTEDPIAQGAPCGEDSQAAGFTLAPGGLEEPLVSVVGMMVQGNLALCPGDGLIPEDGFELRVEAGADNVHVHVVGVGSDGEILALTEAAGARLSRGERLRVPDDASNEFVITGTEGVEYIVFIASVGPLSSADPELARLVELAGEGTGDAERLRMAPRGTVVIDPAAHRVDAQAEAGVAVVPFPIHHRARGRSRGVGIDI